MAPQKEYHSVVHHRDAKPSWFETFKVVLPIDYKDFHLKFIFKHRYVYVHCTYDIIEKLLYIALFCNLHHDNINVGRSSKNRKIKEHEKPFAMSFLRLDDQQNGAVLKDDQHSLQVYKVKMRQLIK